jgi:hypothetical protein
MVEEDGQIMRPVLLSKSELQWLLGNTKVSKTFEYKMLSNIRRKIHALTTIELPLLMRDNLVIYQLASEPGRDLEPVMTLTSLTKSTHALVRQRSRVQIPAKASFFLEKEQEIKTLVI